MLASCDSAGPRGIGTIRSLCLLVIAVGLIILFASSYVDYYESEICSQRDANRQHYDKHRNSIDGRRRRSDDDNENENSVNDVRGTTDDDHSTSLKKNQSTFGDHSSVWDYDWDASARDASATEQRNIPDRNLILVRHGQYDFKTEKLTALGREQARITGERLKAANLSYTEIIHSTMDRAVETAQIIHRCLGNANLPIHPDEMLVEGGPIPPMPTITYWQLPQKSYHRDGPRMEAAFRKYFHRPDKNQRHQTFQILVGHGNIFRFFSLRALQLSRDAWMRVFIAHASITMLHIRADGTVSMTKFGDAGHFPVDKVTY